MFHPLLENSSPRLGKNEPQVRICGRTLLASKQLCSYQEDQLLGYK